MIREAIDKLVRKIDLSEGQTREVFGEIMSGNATPAEIASFLTALRMKGETAAEITGAAKVMREKSLHIKIDSSGAVVDTCGTGGSGINTFNISSTAAFVVAAAGVKVAKHGNRSASSQCGSADVLEALGVKIDVGPDLVQRCILEIGIGFMYAPLFHSAMKYAAPVRKEIGIRTIFNLLGPLSNPAGASAQVVGVYDDKLTVVLAEALKNLGVKHAMVVHGHDGLDEITITGRTKITELKNGLLKTYYVSPEKMSLKKARPEEIEGGSATENAATILSILKGERGPKRDVVLMNTAAALICAASADNFKAGVKKAAELIDSGKALDKLLQLIELTNR